MHKIIYAALVVLLLGCDSAEEKPLLSKCKVNDADISESYSGQCKDGLAHGEGIAKGRDIYQGQFESGDAHGYGTYTWGASSEWPTERWDGFYYRGKRTGYGESSKEAGSKNSNFHKDNGVLEGGRYVIRGLWIAGELIRKCHPENECLKIIPTSNLPELREIASKSKKLTPLNKLPSIIQSTFSDFDEITAGTSQCLASALFSLFSSQYPGKNILTTSEALDVFQLENKRLLFSMLGNCVHSIKSGRPTTTPPIDIYQQVDIDELKGSIDNFSNEKVKVHGIGIYIIDEFYLKRDPGDSTFIIIDPKRLEREQKISIIKECSKNMILGCPITIYGTTGEIGVGFGVFAEKIELHK